jgi:hypothetical protein
MEDSKMMLDRMKDDALSAIFTVGDGRGFVVAGVHRRLVITAGHCLPRFPSHFDDSTYQSLLGVIEEQEQVVWAECLFVDPISDIAILGPPDDQELFSEFEKYENLIKYAVPMVIADARPKSTAWMLNLKGEWFRCAVRQNSGPLWVFNEVEEIVGGMSGSPIVDNRGAAIGIVCLSCSTENGMQGPNPRLTHHLPAWLLRELGLSLTASGTARDTPKRR